ncbi:MAG: hypothetical protein LUC60_06900 [Lachnospiraceae bacterium]|nr:hypothetical protein [Lachnospiraceae bacterium]
MDNHEMLLQRQERIIDAMSGIKRDRTPLLFSGEFALIRYLDPDTTFGYMIREHEEMTKRIVNEFLPKFPKVDYLAAIGMSSKFLGVPNMARTFLPGKELPENEMWQLVFDHIITEDDYDWILKNGWQKFQNMCIFERMGYDADEMQADFEEGMRSKALYREAGFPFFTGDLLPAPYDVLAFGRGLMDFFTDLFECPDKITAVMNMIMDEYEEANAAKIDATVAEAAAKGEKVTYTIAPCVQANCNLVSREMFEEFGWPLIKRQADFILKHGGYVFFHMDAHWTAFLDYFKDFPKGRCLFDSDGFTDLYKIRDTLGSIMAFTGSIAPATLSFGKPDEIYQEAKKQIAEMGNSFILAPSCTLPANMPKENIDAMYAAIDEQ